MKKLIPIAVIIFGIILIGMYAIKSKEVNTEVTKTKTKVGVVMNGVKQDGSWGESHYNGLMKTAETLNLELIFVENAPDECLDIIEELIDDGCKVIVCDSFGFGESVFEAAKKHPEIYFLHATGVDVAKNYSSYFGRIYQMRYLSGIVAGLQTKTNEIGYVAAFPISEVNRGINAFTLGVRSVNPDARVYVSWSNSWVGDEEAQYAFETINKSHDIDVVAMHTNSLRVLELAEEAGIWSIGYSLDNYEKYPDTFLTAPIWNWENFYTPRILECLQKKFKGNHYWEGIDSGIVDLAPLTVNVNEGTSKKVEEAKALLESGEFDVFYGPIYDNEGNLRVGVGESMSDDSMLNSFDWYVEGVVICE